MLVNFYLAQCPPGLNPVLQSSNTNNPQFCTPQDSCSCFSTSKYGAICQYSVAFSNFICCASSNNQCGANSSPQTTANGGVLSCSLSSQCATGYTCNYGVCCPDTSTTSCSSSSNICLNGQVLVNGQCYNSVAIGSRCQRNEQCTGGSTCVSSICQCQNGFVNVNEQCVINNGINCPIGTISYNSQCISLASPGQSCVTSSQCIDNSICSNSICSCLRNFNLVYGYCLPPATGNCKNTQTLINNQCVLYSIVGEACIATSQCVGGAVCLASVCRCSNKYTAMYGYCISSLSCLQNQVAINDQCYNIVQVGGSCIFSKQCITNAACTNGICVLSTCSLSCLNNQVCVNNQCLNYVSPGFQCSASQQCLSNSECIQNICACPIGMNLENGNCITNRGGNGGSTQCATNQIFYNNQCWNTVSIGSQCSISQQCLSNSQCINSICQCTDGNTIINGYCTSNSNGQCNVNQIFYNNQCWNTVSIGSQCSINQQCLSDSQCINTICQCPNGSRLQNGKCSTNISNLCSAGQTVQVDSSGQPINCLISTCPSNSFCQFSSNGQRYVCCRSN